MKPATTLLTVTMLVLSTFAIATPASAQDPGNPPSCEDVADPETCDPGDPGAEECEDGTGVVANAGGEEAGACLGDGGGGSPPGLRELVDNFVENCADDGPAVCEILEKCTPFGAEGSPSQCNLE